ncbi:hypothetical protein [Flavivirga spongiicola]|uniref:Uncharacterized protein n=1 Tax=Flavivirga spongiicola TaxID=421621 RepID=A0ABU7XND4_9FLAO|nr:hypothetical protein [Flavivirga sp. MEBiC05379]MDO5981923.1 hypothetical protein [Flavivirga sp. MEBiC05379]
MVYDDEKYLPPKEVVLEFTINQPNDGSIPRELSVGQCMDPRGFFVQKYYSYFNSHTTFGIDPI